MTFDLESAWTDAASKLRGYIRSRVADHAAAEDILHDVFLKAHARAAQLQSIDNLAGWLFMITRNAVIDHYRTVRPHEEFPEHLPAAEDDPADETSEAMRNAFRRMVFELPEPYREALVLTEFEGLTQKALAGRLGISISGAKSRVQRGREKLKATLLECCQLEFDRRGNVLDCVPRNSNCECSSTR